MKKDGRYACEPFEFAIASLDEVFVFHLGIGNLQDIFARGLLRSSVKGKPSRYAVEYVPIIDPKDREEWSAGATINIYDMETDTLMASKTWYAFETGFGQEGHRLPWVEAIYCPDRKSHDTRFFVDQVIKPEQGD